MRRNQLKQTVGDPTARLFEGTAVASVKQPTTPNQKLELPKRTVVREALAPEVVKTEKEPAAQGATAATPAKEPARRRELLAQTWEPRTTTQETPATAKPEVKENKNVGAPNTQSSGNQGNDDVARYGDTSYNNMVGNTNTDEIISKKFLETIGLNDWTEMNDLQLKAYLWGESDTNVEVERKFTELKNQQIINKNTKILANTKMDGKNVSVLEEMQAIAKMEKGKEKNARKEAVFKKMEELGIPTSDYALYSGDRNFSWDTFWNWAGNAAMSGLAMFYKSISSTTDLLHGKPLEAIGWEDNPISSAAEWYSDTYDAYRYNTNLNRQKLGGGAGLQFAGDVIEGTIGALPTAIMTIMSAGTNLAGNVITSGSNLATKAAYETANILQKAGLTVEGMMKNPQYWMSVFRTLGTDYEEAKAMGASDTVAALGSLTSSFINAGLEIGPSGSSGIQGLPQEIAEEGGSKLLKLLISGAEEGTEESMQKFVNEVVGKTLYDKDLEILNPKEYLREGAIGAVSGLALGGGQIGAQSAINSVNNAIQSQNGSKLSTNEQKNLEKVGWDGRVAVKEATGPNITMDGVTYKLLGLDKNGSKVYQDVEVLEAEAAAQNEGKTTEEAGNQKEGKTEQDGNPKWFSAAIDSAEAASADSRDNLTSVAKGHIMDLQRGFMCFPEGDPLIENSQKVTPKDGCFDVAMHGEPTAVAFGGKESNMSPRLLAEVIRHNPNYHGENIRLLCCSTGLQVDGAYCFAEELANALGVTVEAPNMEVFTAANGTIKVGQLGEGQMIEYKPNERRRIK